MKLHVSTKRERESREWTNIIHAVETSCLREHKKEYVEREAIVTFPPSRPCLSHINEEIHGWLVGRNARSQYTRMLERYENNQCYWLNKWKHKKLDKAGLTKKITDLEKWFACIVEPPPKCPAKVTTRYICDLEEWKERESTKYTASRSYYCYENIVPLLDKKEMLSVQKQLFENYNQVKTFFLDKEQEYEKETKKKQAEERRKEKTYL